MAERYTHQLLKVVVAQVCQTIGWHSIQSTPLELMMDILDQYMRDITRLTHRYAELYNRTDPNLDDVALAYREMGINLGDLQEYLQFVDPITRPFEVPKYPLPKDSHLNFLKPGSKEVLSRPVHIPEHMPPMLVDSEEELEEANRRQMRQAQLLEEEEEAQKGTTAGVMDDVKPEMGDFVEKFEEVAAEEVAVMETSQNQEEPTFKRPPELGVEVASNEVVRKTRPLTEEGRPTREISSVIMTTSGFISPAREGKLPDSKVPEIPEEKPKLSPPPPPTPVALPIAKMDDKFPKKTKKKPPEKEKKKDKKVEKKKDLSERDALSRPATPMVNVAELPPPVGDTEDVKPVITAPEPIAKHLAPSVDVKPEIILPSPEPEKVSIPVAAVKPFEKVKKEKVPRKKRQPSQAKLKTAQPSSIVLNPAAMDIGGLFPVPHSQQGQPPPLLHQVSPPKLPKPKRAKLTKKQIQQQYLEQMQQFHAPLNAQSILEMFTPGKKPLPGMFQPSLFASQQQLQQMAPQKQSFPDSSTQTQLDILQKLHPSLEITPSPGPSSTGSGPGLQNTSPEKHKLNIFKKVAKKDTSPAVSSTTNQGPIIIIDDDKSPPHQPQFPTTPMAKKRVPKTSNVAGNFPFQDTLSSPDMPFNINMNTAEHSNMGLLSSFSRDFSPPKTPSNMPKTPDIKLQSSSSSSASWMSDSGKLSVGPGPIFGDFPNFGMPGPVKEEKKKRQRQKQPRAVTPKKAKNAQLLNELNLLQQFQQQQQQQQQHQQSTVPVGGMDKKPLHDAVSSYTKLLNQAMPPAMLSSQVRNPMFGMFPLPSGPGLIPENPLFNPFSGQPSFFPTGPFGMPAMPPRFDIGNLLRYPRPPKPQKNADSYENLDPETKLAHTPLDLQKSTCNVAPLVPPSLQIEPISSPVSKPVQSRKQTVQSAKDRPSPMQHQPPPPQEHSLNLSTKTTNICSPMPAQSIIPKIPMSKSILPSTFSTTTSTAAPHLLAQKLLDPSPSIIPPPTTMIPAEPMQTLPSAAVLPATATHHLNQPLPTTAVAPTTVTPIAPGETIVIGSDSDTNSQSTVTMAAMGAGTGSGIGSKKDKSEKRKNKEHKKDKKLKEGKIKKKKDKKDKSKSKDRDRERPKSSHSLYPDIASVPDPAPIDTTSAPSDESGLQEQLRRKEKKEKKKEKLKKEKRKEKERVAALEGTGDYRATAAAFGALSGAGSSIPIGTATVVSSMESRDRGDTPVPKLMLKLGSSANPSPRSNTPDVPPVELGGLAKEEKSEIKREASPELARISALVTRPPKSKTPGGKSKIKEEDGTKLSKSFDHSSKIAGKLDFAAEVATVKPRPRGIQPLPDSIDLFSVTPTHNPSTVSGFKSTQHTASAGIGTAGGDSTPHSSKKPSKEPKSSKSHSSGSSGGGSSSSLSVSLGVSIPAPLSAPVNVKDADGNVVWICPACGRVDDGTPMIGCDGCDAWYHWVCVGIQVPPDSNEDWYCRVCIGKKQESHGDEKQRKRKKKDKKNPKE